MTDFTSLADFRASLQRQLAAYGPMIEDLQIERRIAAARLEVLDQVEAIQDAEIRLAIAEGRFDVGEPPADFGEKFAPLPDVEEPPAERAPRQRQDVRGPVLALLQNSATELTAEEIGKLLPDRRPASIRAALHSMVMAAEIETNGTGLYYIEQPSRDNREERRAPAPDLSASLSSSEQPQGDGIRWRRDEAAAREPDARTLTDTSPESQEAAAQ